MKARIFYVILFFLTVFISCNKDEVDISKFERLLYHQNKSFKEIKIFYDYIVDHLISYPDDFPFFVKFVCKFKPFITLKDINNIFEYLE